MSLHVVQLGPYPPPEGGITRNVVAIRKALIARGDECSIIATSRSENALEEAMVWHPRSPFGLIKLLWSLRYDVLHLHIGGNVTTRVLLLALTVASLGGKRSVLTMHSGGYATDENGKGSFSKFVFRRFGTIVAVNDDIANVFRTLNVDPDRVEVIAPYALERADPTIALPSTMDAFYKEHSPVLLSVGGLEREYEPLMQIKALSKIRRKFPNAGLMILGAGSMRAEVEAASARSEARNSIFLAGNVEHSFTLHLMERASAVLRVTQFDGDAISVRESLFLRTPVIATDTGKRPDGVHLIRKGNEADLVEAVSKVVSSGKRPLVSTDDGMQNIRAVLDLYGGPVTQPLKHGVEAIAD